MKRLYHNSNPAPGHSHALSAYSPRKNARRRGAVMVETALCLTLVLLPLTLGIIQYGMVIATSNQMEQIVRQSARFAAVHGTENTFDNADTQANPPSLRYYIKSLCVNKVIDYNDIKNSITVTPATVATRASGLPIAVAMTYPMKKKVFVGKIVPGISVIDNDYKTSATFVME